MNSDEYYETVEEVLIPSAQMLFSESYIYQQDNTPCHKSNATRKWFTIQDIEVLSWSPCSPDPDPIENIYIIMTYRLESRMKGIEQN